MCFHNAGRFTRQDIPSRQGIPCRQKEPIWQCTCAKVMEEPIVSTTRRHKTSVELLLQGLLGSDQPLTLLVYVESRISQVLCHARALEHTSPTGQPPTHQTSKTSCNPSSWRLSRRAVCHASESPSLPNQALASKDTSSQGAAIA